MSSAERRKLDLQQVRQSFQSREGDCGSSEVQGDLAYSILYSQVATCTSLSNCTTVCKLREAVKH